ncbi:OsmC family protein [Mycolicibacterium brumae]|uniref:Peroxiredoxin n=1 Tax=Mycolicibacterium brumae TaxID=85968 RepID=A0A2G5PHY3_9MYCO|nr:OsmC family protein [Mycolicibacterium brumae]MCV7192337.1 OsmC family protein [Mycolicibacterium brumae]PIB77633.1 peroxiredoxin [Mycolicibacterium brumae]RWA18667.1 hypothetical protein MBRU_05495 [Mycolicibacterium brumae DSM 44177]UWW10106.1 OsmC family protein [Mycolicibacterium brumae]
MHRYEVHVHWSGATTGYRDYSRNHRVSVPGQTPIECSADPLIGRGDDGRWNPEQLFVASLSQCHMLWYLHLCVEAGIVVLDYRDDAVGVMSDTKFTEVTLRPTVRITDASRAREASALHTAASSRCYIANSVVFPVQHEPRIESA